MLSRAISMRQIIRGFTIVELLIGITIMATLMALAMPDFSLWMQNSRIRTAAEALQNGVQLARAEAVRRNAPVLFQLTTSLDSACALLPAGTAVVSSNWVVSMDATAGHCGDAPTADLPTPVAPRIVQTRAGGDGSKSASILTDAASITFNGLGRLTPSTSSMAVTVGNSSAACGPSGPLRCLKLIVSPQGQTSMCDPQAAAGAPEACS